MVNISYYLLFNSMSFWFCLTLIMLVHQLLVLVKYDLIVLVVVSCALAELERISTKMLTNDLGIVIVYLKMISFTRPQLRTLHFTFFILLCSTIP